MQMDSSSQGNGPEPVFARHFTRILKAAKPYWQLFWVDRAKLVARGLVLTKKGDGVIGTLSLTGDVARLAVKLGPVADPVPQSVLALLQVVNGTPLAKLVYDKEEQTGCLTAGSFSSEEHAEQVVGAIMTGVRGILSNGDLRSALV